MKLKICVFTAMVGLALSTWAAPEPIASLYQRYKDNGQSSLELPEFGKRIDVSGFVLGHKSGIAKDNTILSVGSHESGDELARLTFDKASEEKKARAFKTGAAFKATCMLGMTMNSSYVALESCTLK